MKNPGSEEGAAPLDAHASTPYAMSSKRFTRNVVGHACALALLVLAAPAAAQQAGGNGIKVGEGRLHPYFDLELRMDSAALYDPNVGANAAEAITHIRPGLKLDVPGNMVALGLNGYADYVWYTGLLRPGSGAANHLGGGVDLNVAVNEKGPVGFTVTDHFVRSDRTSATALGLGAISLYNQLAVGVPIRPGGGALEIIPSGAWTVEFFQPLLGGGDCPGGNAELCNPALFDYSKLTGTLSTRYKFLPKTALVLDASFDAPTLRVAAGSAPPLLLKTEAGISGLITPKVSMLLKAGYGRDFAGTASTVVGHAELAWLASQTASVKAGYLRSLEPVAYYGLYGDDRAYIEGRALLGGHLTLRGYAAYDFLSYYSLAGRNDTMTTLDLGPQYQFNPYFGVAAGYVLSNRTSSSDPNPALNFTRHEGYLRLTLSY